MSEAQGAVQPRPAASLIIVRPGKLAPEVLLLKRSASARFMPNVHVFPGGALDASDQANGLQAQCAGLDEAAANRVLRTAAQGLGYFVAAIRETFEECGLLYAYARDETLVAEADVASLLSASREDRAAQGLWAACAAGGWRLATDRLSFFGHWITPPYMPRRFDTRFFLARAPEAQRAALMSDEMQALCWLSAREALECQERGELLLTTPTQTLLGELAGFGELDALLEYARTPRIIDPITPL